MASPPQKHILLVEDDPDTLSATTAMLERLGYSVRTETESLKSVEDVFGRTDLFDLASLTTGWLTWQDWTCPAHETYPPRFPGRALYGYLDGPSNEQLEATGIGGRVVIKPATRKELSDVLQEALGMGKDLGQTLRRAKDRRSTGAANNHQTNLTCFSIAS